MSDRRSWAVLLAATILGLAGLRAVLAQAAAPLAYVHATTLGTTDTPWQRSNATLNQPWGIGADRDGVWVANAAGRNLVRFGTGPLEEIGRAGSLTSLYGLPARRIADVAVAFPAGQPGPAPTATATKDAGSGPRPGPTGMPAPTEAPDPGPAPAPRRTVWLADAGAHVVVGIPLEPDGRTGQPRILGEHEVAGDDAAHFDSPEGVAVDARGNLFVGDTGNHRVQVFAGDGALAATIGQTGQPGAGTDELSSPARLFVGADRLLYIADSGNDRIQVFDVTNPGAPRFVRTYGPGSGADAMDRPLGLAVDATFLYVADSAHGRVQLIQKSDGRVWKTLDGVAPDACGTGDPDNRWTQPSDVAQDESGNIYVALPDRTQVVMCRAIDRNVGASYGMSRPRTGAPPLPVPYVSGEGLFNAPSGVGAAADGSAVVAELEGHRVVRIRADGRETWASGVAGVAGADDTHFSSPSDLELLPDGRTVVADRGNGRLVVLDAAGGRAAAWGRGTLQEPAGLTRLADGRFAVADAALGRVRLFDAAGNAAGDLADPSGTTHRFAEPADVARDARGTWYVSDRAAHVVHRFDDTGRALAPLGAADTPGDAFDRFDAPGGLALDAAGRLLVADTGNHRVQVFAADGAYQTTLGGVAGPGTGGLREPRGVAAGPDGRTYVADTFNHRVQAFHLAAEPWLPSATNGLARRDTTSITALADVGGRLYAGTGGHPNAGIWRRQAGGAWEAVADVGKADAGKVAVRALGAQSGRMFAGTEHRIETTDPVTGRQDVTSRGGDVWRSDDGTRWTRVAEGGFGDAVNAGVSALGAFGGRVYAGTASLTNGVGGHAPELWRSATGDPGSWQRVRIDLFSRDAEWTHNLSVSAMTPYSGTLVVGTCGASGPQVWASADGDVWRAIGSLVAGEDPRTATPQIGSGGAACVTALVEHDGFLYAGLGNEPAELGRMWAYGAAEVWRCRACDGTDWEPAVARGLGQGRNNGRVALAAFDEPPFRYLYLAVGNAEEGAQVWRSPDGLDWEPLVEGGFGDDDNIDVGSGAAIAVSGGRLHIGTRNLAHGGEIWSTAGSRPGLVPTPPGPSPTPTPRPSPQPPVGRARYHKVDEWPLAPAAAPNVVGNPVDAALADNGTFYLLDSAPVRVLPVQADGTWAPAFGGSGSEPDRITRTEDGGPVAAIAADTAAGRVYVSDLGTERVVVFDLDGAYQTAWGEIYAVDLDVRPDGSVWVADLAAGAVRRLGPNGVEIERMGLYGPSDEDGLLGLTSAVEDPAGRLWVGDQGGDRLRAYERTGGIFRRVRTVNLTTRVMAGCSAVRLQALGDNRVLAGGCVLERGRLERRLPVQHTGSDLYGVRLRTANLGAGRFAGLATYDIDRFNDLNETFPTVVRYFDEDFDIVTASSRGRWFDGLTAAADAIIQPVRLSTAPDGTLYLTDDFGLRRFSPEGRVLDVLGTALYPSRSAQLALDPRLVVGTGETGMVVGVGDYVYGRRGTTAQQVVYGRSVKRRYCQARVCQQGIYLEPIWDTTIATGGGRVPQVEYNYAVAHEPTRNQFVLLQLYVDNPAQVEYPARLFLFPIGGQGRKTEVALDGYDRRVLWTDVDAGADGRILVLDTLRDLVQVFDAEGRDLGRVSTPKDAWRVAAGPNREIYVLTTYGHVVRMAADGAVLSRFVGLPNDVAPFTAQVDLAVDAWGRVFVADNLYQQVTVFEAEGTEDDVLEGARCRLAGDKLVAPTDILLGDTAELVLTLFGTCGYVEEPADIVLAVNAVSYVEQQNLRVARQILSVIDLDRHRAGVLSYVVSGNVEAPLTHDRDPLIRALLSVTGGRPTGCGVNTMAALRTSQDVFDFASPRQKILIVIAPPEDPQPGECAWDDVKIAAAADELKRAGVRVVAVNGPLQPPTVAASSEILARVQVAARGQGVGRAPLRRSVVRRWPDHLVTQGTLVDRLPANIDYVAGSAMPPATWDAAARTLTWQLADLVLGQSHRFTLRIRPQKEGLWPTNVEAKADAVDGWGNPVEATLPVPKIRVYGELPTPTPTRTATPTPTSTPRPTIVPEPIFLPVLLKSPDCAPETRNADVALVIDTSGSMSETTSPGGPTKLEAAREAARSFIRQLVAGRDQAALVQFNSAAVVLVPLSADPAVVEAGLARLTPASGTRIDMALDAARGELTGPNRRRTNNPVLILLTDGEPTGTTPEDVRAAAARAHAANLLVFTIGLGQAVDAGLMRDVASRPEWYFAAPDTSDLAAIYSQIAYAIPCTPEWP